MVQVTAFSVNHENYPRQLVYPCIICGHSLCIKASYALVCGMMANPLDLKVCPHEHAHTLQLDDR